MSSRTGTRPKAPAGAVKAASLPDSLEPELAMLVDKPRPGDCIDKGAARQMLVAPSRRYLSDDRVALLEQRLAGRGEQRAAVGFGVSARAS